VDTRPFDWSIRIAILGGLSCSLVENWLVTLEQVKMNNTVDAGDSVDAHAYLNTPIVQAFGLYF